MKKPHYAWVVMVACCGIIFTGIGIFNNTTGVFFLPIAETLGVGVGDVSLRSTIRALSSMMIMTAVPRVFARFGIRRVMAASMIISCGCFFLMSTLTKLWQFYAVSVVMGVCGPFLTNLPVPLIINNWFSKNTGAVLGLVLAFTGVGGGIMSPVASAIIESHGWPTAYRVLGAVGAVVALPAILIFLRVSPEEMGLEPYGYDPEKVVAPKPIGGQRARDFLHNPAFITVVGFSICLTLVSNMYSHMPTMASTLGYSGTTSALTASVVMLGLIVGKLGIGGLSDKTGLATSISIACVAGIAGVVMLIFGSSSLLLLMGGALLLGISTALPSIATPLVVTHVFGKERYTVASSYISLCTSLVGAVSVSLYGFIFDYTGTYIYALILLAIMLVMSIVTIKKLMKQTINV